MDVDAASPAADSPVMKIPCKSCGQEFEHKKRGQRALFCSHKCRMTRAPAVYRFVCPDGRSYVGSRGDIRSRQKMGMTGQNQRLREALQQFPSDAWRFEVLEVLRPGCELEQLRQAEQRHMDRFQSWSPDFGFNAEPAIWKGNGPAQQAGREFRKTINAAIRERQRRRSLGLTA
jgi:hypothetical protein